MTLMPRSSPSPIFSGSLAGRAANSANRLRRRCRETFFAVDGRDTAGLPLAGRPETGSLRGPETGRYPPVVKPRRRKPGDERGTYPGWDGETISSWLSWGLSGLSPSSLFPLTAPILVLVRYADDVEFADYCDFDLAREDQVVADALREV